MKKILVILLCSCCLQANTQISTGLKIGMSPPVHPGTAPRLVNRHDGASAFLFNTETVKYTPTFGAMVRIDDKPFWFSAECLFYGWTETYVRQSLFESNGKTYSSFEEKNYVLEAPVSIGISLGKLEIFSGFSPGQTLRHTTQLQEIAGYSSSLPQRFFGWHSGAGVNLGSLLIDVRYTQQFSNYGRHRFINGEELTLGNGRARMTVTCTYRF